MTRRTTAMLLLSAPIALVAFAQTQEPPRPRPQVINTTYVLTFGASAAVTCHLHEEEGKLVIDRRSRDAPETSESVDYDKVSYVEVVRDFLAQDTGRRRVDIGDSEGKYVMVTLPTEADAEAVAEYVARKASLHLELIAGAWRVRKPFECPDATQPGCRDFKELLDHDDPDIAGYFYASDENDHVYACFSNAEPSFFILRYTHYGKYGTFSLAAFRNGQADRMDFRRLDWSLGDIGALAPSPAPAKQGEKPQTSGWIDPSSFSYQTSFTNRMNTTTEYGLGIRWSTGRYTESYSGKDDKGNRFSNDSGGICLKLH